MSPSEVEFVRLTQVQDLLLTVVIPTKDRPRLLTAAVASALAALPERSEVHVVDDRSTPPIAGTLPADPRLRITVNQATPGASGARNWGVTQARGQRILFLDDDDLLLPGYAAWVLLQRGDYGFSAARTFYGLDTPDLPPFRPGDITHIGQVRPFRRQVAGLGCGFWIDRAAFLDADGIAEDIRVNEDTEFSIRLLRAGLSGMRSAEPGVMVRSHGGAAGERGHLTSSAKASERAGYFGLILSRHADWLETRPDAARHLLQRQLKLLARARESDSARAVLASRLARPHRLSLWLYFRAEALLARLGRG